MEPTNTEAYKKPKGKEAFEKSLQNPKGRMPIAIIILLVLVAGMFMGYDYWINKKYNGALIGDMQVHRYYSGGNKTENGFVKVDFVKDNDKFKYYNAGIDLNHDGQFTEFTQDGKVVEEWFVRNAIIDIKASTDNNFEFSGLGVNYNDDESYQVMGVLTQRKMPEFIIREMQDCCSKIIEVPNIQKALKP